MPLGTGTRLGPYEILGAVGAGGMGEVYRARDTRLERQVAIKVLPEHLSSNAGLRERFEREAKVISGLSHPNICTLYDVGQEDGREFLVMEFVEGETLAARLERGPLPADQAIRIAASVAAALDKAHRNGIVHRDLKPANIMLTRDGAKLLDFGLAKLKPQPIAVAAAALTELTADDRKLTAEGTIVGTFQYMSPEQLEGAEADPRTDIFSLGAVLYEMVTGRAAFAGKTKASLIASILSAEPAPISTIQPASPPALDRVIRACIAKDPADRIQTAHDLRLQLELVAESGSQVAIAPPVPVSRKTPFAAGAAGALLLAGLLAVVGYWLGTRERAQADVVRSSITLEEGNRLPRLSNQVVALSADGKKLVYAAITKGELNLFVRPLDGFMATKIPGTTGGYSPAISPDGEWVAFAGRGRSLFKVRLDGGAVLQLASTSDLIGMDWAEDGNIYFSEWAKGIMAVPAEGGEVRKVTQIGSSPDDRVHLWPQLLPGGKHLIFTVWTGKSFDDARIEIAELATGKRTVIATGGTYGRYIATGHVLYARSGVLLAQPFDLENLRPSGTPFPVVDKIHTGASNGEARYAVSASGTLAYVPGGFTSIQRELVIIDRAGKATRVTEDVRPYSDVRMSPDGRYVATTIETSTFDVWLLDTVRDTLSKVTFGADDTDPVWTPDGSAIVYSSSAHGQSDLFLKRLDSNEAPRQLTNDAFWDGACCWLPDGTLVYNRSEGRDNANVAAVSLSGGEPRSLVATPAHELPTSVSPDGKWLVYLSNRSGRMELYVQSLSGPAREWQISRDGAEGGWWLPNSREIIFASDGAVWVVKLATGDDLNPSRPEKLFSEPDPEADWDSVAVTPNGRLLVSREVSQASDQAHINLVQNWFSELKPARR